MITIKELSLKIWTELTLETFNKLAFNFNFSVASLCNLFANSSAVPVSDANNIVKLGINSG